MRQQHPVRIHQPDLLPLPNKRHRLAAPQPRPGADPGRCASPSHAQSMESSPAACAAALRGTKKILRPMSSPNTGSISDARHFAQPGGLDVSAPGNPKPRIALQVSLENIPRMRTEAPRTSDDSGAEEDPAPFRSRPPPRSVSLFKPLPSRAREIALVWIRHRQRHAGKISARGHDRLRPPKTRIGRRIIFPGKRTSF